MHRSTPGLVTGWRLVSALGLTVASALLLPNVVGADTGPYDSVAGSMTTIVTFGEPGGQASFSAQEGPVGLSGHIQLRLFTGDRFNLDVACLAVDGSKAAALGIVGENEGLIELRGVVVEGGGEGDGATRDKGLPAHALVPEGLPLPLVCRSLLIFFFPPFLTLPPIEAGNVVVHDRTP